MSKNKSVPAYLHLVLDIISRAQKLGLTVERDMDNSSTLPENGGYCFVRVNGGAAALIIPKHAAVVKWCDSHIDWEGEEGYEPHPKGTYGAVLCRINPAETDLDAYLTRLAGASKAASKRASGKASQQALDAMTAALKALGMPASPATPSTPVGPTVGDLVEDLEDDLEINA